MKISRHARNNMRLYKISESDILDTIELPEITDMEEDRIIAIKSFYDKFSDYPLKVVYTKEKDEIFIISAYPLKKKIWR